MRDQEGEDNSPTLGWDEEILYLRLPEQMKDGPGARIYSPRLAHPEQAVDFEMEVIDVDEYFRERIEINPDVMAGKPVIRGTRIPVDLLVRLRAHGMSEVEILHEYPRLQPEDIAAALLYAEAQKKP